jgi:predicted phosphoadenosine phosphosulfate sulfurtransferase
MEELNIAPSYKSICIAILKNDNQLKRLGFSIVKTNYYHELKRIQLGINCKQLKLDL